jgi:NUMOD3 motif
MTEFRVPYRKQFLARTEPGPWRCYGCKKIMRDPSEFVIHHVDEDRTNNKHSNLKAMHRHCHKSMHHSGKIVSEETKTKVRAALSGHPVSDDTKAKIRRAMLGRKLSAETKAKISAARRGKTISEETRANMSQAQRTWRQQARERKAS